MIPNGLGQRLIVVGRSEKPTVGYNDHPTNRDGLKELAVAGRDTLRVVTYKTAECKVIIPREWIPLESSTQQTKYCDNRGRGEGDRQDDPKFCLSGLHLGHTR